MSAFCLDASLRALQGARRSSSWRLTGSTSWATWGTASPTAPLLTTTRARSCSSSALSLLPPVLLLHREHAVSAPRAQGLPAAVQAGEHVRRAGRRVALAAAGAAARQLAQRPGRALHPGPHHAAGAPSQPSTRSAAGTRAPASSVIPGKHCQSCCRRLGAPSTWRSRASCRRCRRPQPASCQAPQHTGRRWTRSSACRPT